MRRYPTWSMPARAWALVAAALGGCSGDEPGDGASDETASNVSRAEKSAQAAGCALLTAEEIQAATGRAPDGAEEGTGSVRGCDWMAEGRPLVAVVVSAAPRTYDEYMQNVREQMGSNLNRIEMTRVEGVGDYAIWHAQDGPDYLNAVEDGVLLVVMIWREPANGKSPREAAVELARSALPRL
jgi:hypothetical protein